VRSRRRCAASREQQQLELERQRADARRRRQGSVRRERLSVEMLDVGPLAGGGGACCSLSGGGGRVLCVCERVERSGGVSGRTAGFWKECIM